MRKLVAVLFFLLCTTFLQAKDKPNPADFSIKVHISASHMEVSNRANIIVYSDATLNGKKFPLAGTAVALIRGRDDSYALVVPGDYLARLTKDYHNADRTAIHQEYDVLLLDGTVWHRMISGIS